MGEVVVECVKLLDEEGTEEKGVGGRHGGGLDVRFRSDPRVRRPSWLFVISKDSAHVCM
jgi:hypothetical protein